MTTTRTNLGAVILQAALCAPRPALKGMLRTMVLYAPRDLLQRMYDVAVAHNAVPDDRGSRWQSPPAFVLQAVLEHVDFASCHELTQVAHCRSACSHDCAGEQALAAFCTRRARHIARRRQNRWRQRAVAAEFQFGISPIAQVQVVRWPRPPSRRSLSRALGTDPVAN